MKPGRTGLIPWTADHLHTEDVVPDLIIFYILSQFLSFFIFNFHSFSLVRIQKAWILEMLYNLTDALADNVDRLSPGPLAFLACNLLWIKTPHHGCHYRETVNSTFLLFRDWKFF